MSAELEKQELQKLQASVEQMKGNQGSGITPEGYVYEEVHVVSANYRSLETPDLSKLALTTQDGATRSMSEKVSSVSLEGSSLSVKELGELRTKLTTEKSKARRNGKRR